MRTITLLVAATALLGGCATLRPEAGLDTVSREVERRAGHSVAYRRGDAADQAVRERVRALLAEPLTAESAVQVALLANPRVQASLDELRIAEAERVQAGLLPNPFLDVTVTEPRGEDRTNLDVGVSFELLSLLTVPLRKALAEGRFQAAELRVTGEVLDLAARVRAAFIEAQAAAQREAMLTQVVTATDASLTAAKRLRAAGNITRLALDRKQALHEQARLTLAEARTAVAARRERLNALMGLWGTATDWQMAPRLPRVDAAPDDLADVERRAVEASLDLAVLRLQMEGIGKRMGLANLESVIPELEAGFVWERDDGEWEDGPAIGLQIPLFDMGQARRARLVGELSQRRVRYRALAIEVRSAARAAARSLATARSRERHLREVLLPLRERITGGTLLEYNAMQVGVFRLLQARQRQIDTAMAYVDALRDYWLARGRLDLILAGRLSEAAPAPTTSASAPAMADAGGGGH